MITMKKAVGVFGLSLFFPALAAADDSVAIVARASTQGLGGEVVFPLAENINLRGGVYGFKLSHDDTASDIEYDLDAKLFSAGGYLDWHVFGGGFRLSAGALYDTNKLVGASLPNQTYNIGGTEYASDDVGQLNGRVTANKFAPYAGIGWGNAVSSDNSIKILFDLGVMYHGRPDATLSADIPADSPLRDDPALMAQFQADLAQERMDFQEDVADYKFYPVVSVGVSFAF
ncbi:hypothetical protein [Kordiimonas aestuarii]|uniref:hypothetical protein n=1 Tax=Kordiimonas aestuarii TaxID=1005925 RepID=UPI0021D0AEC3|nr:hypothetical protein [Kordiimonas aestuarii]